MELLQNEKYQKLVETLSERFPDWGVLDGKTFVISGATGMIGSLLIDMLMARNERLTPEARCRIVAVSRSEKTARDRFGPWFGRKEFQFLSHDVAKPMGDLPPADILIHAASTTHPVQYAAEPINTIFANIDGARNMLDAAGNKAGSRFLLLSSVEIYGENRGDVDYFDESYCGYLDCNTLRAGYPEAKRVSEALCQAYAREKGTDAVILRLPRAYGPTMRMNDSKAVAQFIKKALVGENIVLKSPGEQLYSYTFVGDAVLGMLYVLTRGESGQAYNLGDSGSDIKLKDLAALLARAAGTKVVFDLPAEAERAGYSTATKALLNADKLKSLGWNTYYDVAQGIALTIEILREGEQTDVGAEI